MSVAERSGSSAPGNWGRWGAEDERGALNLLTPARVRAAVEAVGEGRVVSLAQPLDAGTPVSRGRPPLAHHMVRDAGDYALGGRLLGRSRFAEDVVALGTHTGTHVDALAHVWYDEHLYNGHDQRAVRSSGAARCGADALGPIVARGLLLDVAAEVGVDVLPVDFAIDDTVLERCCERGGGAPRAGDVVLLHTGWMTAHGGDGAAYFAGEPGLVAAGAAWLVARDVAVVGADNYAIERLDERSTGGFPVHELLLRDHGVPLIENLVLGELAAAGAREFLFVATPLPLRGATASPLAPVAIL
ncbi:MAG: cyclase family protein [Conexibacter sp.]|nr:cyclase family protein [Conexibacter sp.]